MVFETLLAREVAVLTAVTVTVPVTLLDCVRLEVELLLPPPQPVIATAESKATAPSGRRAFLLAANSDVVAASARALNRNSKPLPLEKPECLSQSALEDAVEFEMVRVALPEPVTVPGMAQVVFDRVDGTEQVKETVPENPPTGLTVTVELPDEESATVSVEGLTVRV